MDAIAAAILGAGIPLLEKVLALGGLFVKAKVQGLTLAEVQDEIDNIIKTSKTLDDEENAAAGLS